MTWYDTPCEDSDGNRTTLGKTAGLADLIAVGMDTERLLRRVKDKAEFGRMQDYAKADVEMTERSFGGFVIFTQEDNDSVLPFDSWVEVRGTQPHLALAGHFDTWVRLVYTGSGGDTGITTEFWEICVEGKIHFYYHPSMKEAQRDVYLRLGHKVYA